MMHDLGCGEVEARNGEDQVTDEVGWAATCKTHLGVSASFVNHLSDRLVGS